MAENPMTISVSRLVRAGFEYLCLEIVFIPPAGH